MLIPGFADIERAAGLLKGHVIHTPTLHAPRLSALTGAEVFVKYENMQATGSFKERGALVRLLGLTQDERQRGVIAMSAGNHAQAVAYHAARLGVPATLVMPVTTPFVKIANTRAHGARVILQGETVADAQLVCEQMAREEKLTLVHPYDDPHVIAGQGTIALEMLGDVPDLDMLVVPIGGGGLISGIMIGAHVLRPDIKIIGVESMLYPSAWNALNGDKLPIGGATLAEGIAVKNIGSLTLPLIRAHLEKLVLVAESALERAVNAFATTQRTLAEGAGAAGLAAMLTEPETFRGQRVGLVLCGGNIDARILASIMVRELEREARIISLRLTASDRPGLLGIVATRIGALDGNILEVSHRRLMLDVPAKGVSIDLVIETRDRAHADLIMADLAKEGLSPQLLPVGDGA